MGEYIFILCFGGKGFLVMLCIAYAVSALVVGGAAVETSAPKTY